MRCRLRSATFEEAIASGFFDLPDEPGMIRIPVTINVEIPLHLLYPPQPPKDQHAPDDRYDVAEDEANREARRRRAAGCEFIAEGIREMCGPAAVSEKAAFRDMLQVIRGGQGQGLPALPGDDAEERAAFCDLLKVIHGSRGQSFPTLPAAEPVDTTDAGLPRIVVDSAASGNSAAATTATHASAALPTTTAPVSLPAARAGQAAVDGGATASAAAAPGPIDPVTLPQASLDSAQYAMVVARNQYLASKYDPSSTADRAENLVTGAMSDPARVLTPGEQAEHKALSAAIFRTLLPPPTPDEARLDAIAASPLGKMAFLGVRATGGSQASQDLALNLGTAVGGIGLSAAGPRAGPATAFLGAQTGGSVSGSDRALESERSFNPIVDGGGLMTHENAGGHVVKRHVGQSEADLLHRLTVEPKIAGSSSFHDRETAESAISQALNSNSKQIADWLSGSLPRLRVDYTGQSYTGVSVTRGASKAVGVNSIRIIIVRDPSLPIGYRIQTAFPTKP